MPKRKSKEVVREGKGFLIVATKRVGYYKAAVKLAESILDFWPDARITLFTEERWIDQKSDECALGTGDYQLFENVITWEVPAHIRAKLWALQHTPYETTCYLDCDMYCEHEDIENIFDLLEDKDLVFTKIRPYNAKLTKLSNTEEMTAHCGWFIYNSKPETIKLMSSWWGEYCHQQEPDYELEHYPKDAIKWDTFTMWRLLEYSDHGVNWGFVKDPDARWNFVNGYKEEELQGAERVLYHYTIPEWKLDE
jgi:hypothetical protein